MFDLRTFALQVLTGGQYRGLAAIVTTPISPVDTQPLGMLAVQVLGEALGSAGMKPGDILGNNSLNNPGEQS